MCYMGALTRTCGGTEHSSSMYKHYHNKHGKVPEEPNKINVLVHEKLFVTKRKPTQALQDSIYAKVFL